MSFPLSAIYAPVQAELDQVNACIDRTLQATPNAKLRQINQYLLGAPGKRLRPLLCLLSHKIVAPDRPILAGAIDIAASLELMHMASLIHDDVIDHAQIRHNQPTIHHRWGQEVAIPMGVYLYTLSLERIAHAGDLRVLRQIGHAVKKLCEGELHQVLDRGNLDLDLVHYLLMVKKKTAVLFATATHCGALLAGVNPIQAFALKHVGYGLGMLFQISDDYMDIMGNTQVLGKQAGQDVAMGEVTLPFLYLLEELPSEKRAHLVDLLARKDPALLSEFQVHLSASQALDKTKALAKYYVELALTHLQMLPESPYRSHLATLIDILQVRAFG